MSTHTGLGVGTVTCLPHQGAGMVARLSGDVFLVAGGDADAQEQLLEVCSSVVRAGGDGRDLVRALAGSITSASDEPPPFAALAPTGDQMIVFVHGDAEVESAGVFSISGRESLAWVDRVVPWPLPSVTASVPGPRQVAVGAYNLRDGAVPGAGLTLITAGGSAAEVDPVTVQPPIQQPAPDAPEPSPAPQPPVAESPSASVEIPAAPEAPAVPETPDPSAPPPDATPSSRRPEPGRRSGGDRLRAADVEPPAFESVVIGLPDHAGDDHAGHDHAGADADVEPEPARAPLPVAGERQPRDAAPERPQVRGVYCKNNHFNDGNALFCAVCGINMVQQTPVLTEGPRPPLGVLVLDDGSVFQLDDEYVLGRDPHHDEAVSSGRRRALVLDDDFKTVSRAHARIELHDWDVVLFDNGSANGTFAAAEGETAWQYVAPGTPYTLRAGARVLIGRRTLVYNTHRSG